MILERLEKLAFGLDMNYININLVMWKVVQGMYEGIINLYIIVKVSQLNNWMHLPLKLALI